MVSIRSITTTIIVMTVVAATLVGFSGVSVTPVGAQGITGPTLGAGLQNAGVSAGSSTGSQTHADVAAQAMNVTVPFVENRGQTDGQVAYYATTFYGTVYVTGDGITHSIQDRDNRTLVLTEQFVDGNGNPLTLHPQGEEPSATVVSSFTGSDPGAWQANLPTFTTVSLGEVYPGITVELRASGSSVEKLFVVAPGANVDDVHVTIHGADGLTVDAAGRLVIGSSEFENVSLSAPHAFQDNDVASAYTVTGDTYGFIVGSYDDTKPLTIDPGLSYSTYLGGSGADLGYGIAVDSGGNAYITGYTDSINFPTLGAFQTSIGGPQDAFVTKLNAAGTALVYSSYLGGSGSDQGRGIAVDGSGNAYLTGYTDSANFPITPGAFQTTFGGQADAFVTKLNPTGTALVYSSYLGGSGVEQGVCIAVDSGGNAYVTGYAVSTNFPTTPGAFQVTFAGGTIDAFFTELNPAGTALVYSSYLGGGSYDYGYGIAVDSSGNAYVTGWTASTNFPTTAGAFQTTFGGGAEDTFVTKLNPTGTALVYSSYLGGGSYDDGEGIAVDGSGNAYVTGYTASTDFPTTAGAFQTTFAGGAEDAFVTKVNAAGAALVYSSYLGGSGHDYGFGIAVDSGSNAYVTGYTYSIDFPTTAGAFQTTFGGTIDAFFTELNPAGTALVYSSYLGGGGYDDGEGIAVDGTGNAYVTGYTASTDFPTTAGALQGAFGGSGDAFVTKITTITPAPGPGPAPVSPPTVLVVTGTDGALWWQQWIGGLWSGWHSLGGSLTAAPCVTTQAGGVIDVFGRGTSGGLWHRHTSDGGSMWTDWESLGGQLAPDTGPASCSPGSGTLDVFVTGTSGALWQREYKSGGWSDWQSVGGTLTASPAAASQDNGVIDVFGRGESGALWQREYRNGAWSDWTSLGGQLASGTGPACSWGAGRLGVFVTGTSGALWHWSGSWDSQSLGGYTTSSPEVVSLQSGVLDVVVSGSGISLWEGVYSGGWSGWQPFGALPP